MLMIYTGGLAKAAPASGRYPAVAPGVPLDIEDENEAARLAATGEWERADEGPAPVEQVTAPPAPQNGG